MARNPKQDANMAPPFDSNQSREEARKNGRKGGVKSGQVRRAKRDARQAARYILGLTAKGAQLENTLAVGAKADDGITNIEVLHARLFTMALGGNLEAYNTIMKMAGYEPEENRKERESVASDRRRDAEVEAKVNALGGSVEDARVAVNTTDEDGANDVIIYLPAIEDEKDCELDAEDNTESVAYGTDE